MRNFVKLSPHFWTGETGLALREVGGGPQLIALYLLSSPHTNYIGLFRLPIAYLASDLGLHAETAREYLRMVENTGFCKYDNRTETVWVVEAARQQIGELAPKDKVVVLVQREYDAVPKGCPFLDEFHAKYQQALHLKARNGAAPVQAKGEAKAPAKVETKPAPKAPAKAPAKGEGTKQSGGMDKSLEQFLEWRIEQGADPAEESRITQNALALGCPTVAYLALKEARDANDCDCEAWDQYVKRAIVEYENSI